MKKNRKIKNILINPRYQLKYVFWLNVNALGLIFIYARIVYEYIQENYLILVDLAPITAEARLQLYSELNEIIIKLGIISLLFLVVVTLFGLLFSHRTAGPLFHFEKVFKEVKGGNTACRIKLRPKDEFRSAAIEFNEMMDKLTEKKN